MMGRERRVERGTELDVAGAYNGQFVSVKKTGKRTSMIVDPADGRVPPLTPERRRFKPPTANSVSPCCNRPRPARANRSPAAAANTIPSPRRDAPSWRRATTPRG
jgi:hypothetical protein